MCIFYKVQGVHMYKERAPETNRSGSQSGGYATHLSSKICRNEETTTSRE